MFGHICGQHLQVKQFNFNNNLNFRQPEQRQKQYYVCNLKVSHHVNDHFAQRLSLLFAEVLKDVTVILLQELKADSQVVILQHRRVVVHQGQL